MHERMAIFQARHCEGVVLFSCVGMIPRRPSCFTNLRSGGRRIGGPIQRAALAVTAFILVVAFGMDAGAAQRRIALVIGNGSYVQTPLLNTINDARSMTKTLGQLGFSVTTKMNISQREMHRAIVQFGRELEKGGVGLFYYAGHAVQIRGKNYMIPIGASINVEDHVESESVDLNKVFARMGGARNKLNIVILDACRDNPFGESFRFYSEGLAQARAPANTFVAYAAAPGEVASDGSGSNSYYTGALVEELVKEGVTIEETFKRVRASVMAQTNRVQVPWTASSMTQEFYFKPRLTTSKGEEVSRAIDREVVFWQSISESTRIGDFEAYLRQFPEGTFADLAHVRLKELRQREPVRETPPKSEAQLDEARSDTELAGVIDRAIEDAKEKGDDYAGQIAAAVEALNAKRRQFEENERKAEKARRQVAAAIRERALKKYETSLANARVAAIEAEKAQVAAGIQDAETKRQATIKAAQAKAKETSAALLKKSRQQTEENERQNLRQAELIASDQYQNSLLKAGKAADAEHEKSMAAATKRADQMRQRLIDAAREKADKAKSRALEAAKQKAGEARTAWLVQASAQAKAEKDKVLSAVNRQIQAAERKIVTNAEEAADKTYRQTVAKISDEAKKARLAKVSQAERAAKAERDREIANLAPSAEAAAKSRPAPLPSQVKQLLRKAPQELRPEIESSVRAAQRKGANSEEQLRAAWAIIRERNKARQSSTSGERPPGKDAETATAMKSEVRKIVDKAIRDATGSGSDHKSQVRAALEAVKTYRAKEAEKSNALGAMLTRMRKNPELGQIIDKAMADAKSNGENYEGQVRAALTAIKKYRAKVPRSGR